MVYINPMALKVQFRYSTYLYIKFINNNVQYILLISYINYKVFGYKMVLII